MRAAIVGVGFMGWIHYLAYQASGRAELVAFCSRDAAKRAGDWRGIKGNFGPSGEQIDVSGLNTYATLEQMLQDPTVDLVDICLPPHLHAETIAKCLAAGKHVLCEKPLALDGQTAAKLASQAAPGQLMVAHILPFMPEFQILVDAARDGRYGKVLGGNFKRLIGPPDWIPDFYDVDSVGGPLIDLHVHDAHLICMLFGMPLSVFSRGRMRGQTAQYFESTFATSDPAVVISATGGVIDQPGRPFTHGFEVHFEKATLRHESAAYSDGTSDVVPLVILHADGRVERPQLQPADATTAFVSELDAAAATVAGQSVHPALDATNAANALRLCDAQLQSLKNGCIVSTA